MLSEQQIERVTTMYQWLNISPAELECHEPCSHGRTYLDSHRWCAASAWAVCNNPGYMLWLLMHTKGSVTRELIQSLAIIMAKHCLPKLEAALPTYPLAVTWLHYDATCTQHIRPTVEQAQGLVTRSMQLLLLPSNDIIEHTRNKYSDLIESFPCFTRACDTEENLLWYEGRQAAMAIRYALTCHRIFLPDTEYFNEDHGHIYRDNPHRAVYTLVDVYIHADNTYNGSPKEQEQFNQWCCDTIRMVVTPALRECITPEQQHDEESE